MTTKPFKGEIHNWWKSPITDAETEYCKKNGIKTLGYVICGDIKGHPWFKDTEPGQGDFNTSLVVADDGNLVETLNSMYDLWCRKVVEPSIHKVYEPLS